MARVLLFGRLADVAGWRDRIFEGASIADIRAVLGGDAELAEALAGPGVQVAVDRAIGTKPKGHDFQIARGSAPAVARHMSTTGG